MEEGPQQVGMDEIINELSNRIRILESRQTTQNERLLLVNQNLIEQFKKTMTEIKSLNAEFKDIKKDIYNIKNIVKHLSEEASSFAKRDSLKILEKYINLWNPLNFVTEQGVERLIEEKLKGKKRAQRNTHK